jgi:mRNA-degrading endonuclease RelE of RelBE toxin-antitoxin system
VTVSAPLVLWRLYRTEQFVEDMKDACGRDGALRSRVEKKIGKLQQNPDRPRGGKRGPLAGLKSERVDPYVILYSVEPTPERPPGILHLRGFWHHNDRRYDS